MEEKIREETEDHIESPGSDWSESDTHKIARLAYASGQVVDNIFKMMKSLVDQEILTKDIVDTIFRESGAEELSSVDINSIGSNDFVATTELLSIVAEAHKHFGDDQRSKDIMETLAYIQDSVDEYKFEEFAKDVLEKVARQEDGTILPKDLLKAVEKDEREFVDIYLHQKETNGKPHRAYKELQSKYDELSKDKKEVKQKNFNDEATDDDIQYKKHQSKINGHIF